MENKADFRSLLLAFAIVAGSGPLAWADLIVSSSTRTLVAAATGAPGDGGTTGATGTYTDTASTLGSSKAGSMGSDADQSSVVPSMGPGMTGVGHASAFASATGETGFSNTAQSFFDVFFTVSSSGFYGLDASVKWSLDGDTPPYMGTAIVELIDVTNSTTLASLESNPTTPGVKTLSDAYFLTATVSYRLRANAQIGGGFGSSGDYNAAADWSLIFIPEPSAVVLSAIAGGALVLFAAQRRRVACSRKRSSR